MELGSLQTASIHEEGAEVNILSPVDGTPTDVFIKIMGADSKPWRDAKKKQASKINEHLRNGGKYEELDYDSMDAEALASVTLEWKGITKDGKAYKCTLDNALALYADSPAVSSQLLAFISDRENFISG